MRYRYQVTVTTDGKYEQEDIKDAIEAALLYNVGREYRRFTIKQVPITTTKI